MTMTNLLPPITGVRMAWAFTGAFSDDPHSQLSTVMVEETLKDLKERSQANDKENKYIVSVIATLNASRRSLDTVYKGRQLKFDENEKLRTAYLEEVREKIEFGTRAQDLLKSLPAITIGAFSGVTFSQWISRITGLDPDVAPWVIGLIFAAIGYLVNLLIVDYSRHRTQNLYIRQYYDRSVYYDQYVSRVANILTSLYLDLDRIHKNVFGQSYPMGDIHVNQVVNDMLRGIRPTFCPYLHKHIYDLRKVTPERWSLCETGIDNAVKTCRYWEGPKP